MEDLFKRTFPGLAAKRIRAETDLYQAEKEYEQVVQYHNHGAGNHNAMDYTDEINDSDVDIGESKEILLARSRDEYMGNPLANGAIKRIRTNVIGSGIKLKSTFDNDFLGLELEKKEEIEKRIENLWRMWTESTECDWGRQRTFAQIQSLALMNMLIDGEGFVTLSFDLNPGELFGLKVRLLDSASCVNPSDIGNKDIKNGVEKNKKGAISAYYFKKNKDTSETIRIPITGSKTGRKNILVLMDHERIGQRRGVPIIAPSLEVLHQMRKFTHSELMAANINSTMAFFIENENNDTKGNSPFKSKNNENIRVKHGIGVHLAPGQKIVSPDLGRPNSEFTKFMNTMCGYLGAALGLSPELLLLKFSNNYSASKGALMEAWKMLKMRRQWFIDDFMQPIYEEFLDYCVAMEYIELPGYEDPLKKRAYQKAQWFGQAQGAIDPLKEAKASEIKVKNLFTTRAKESRELNGTDIDDNLTQQSSEKKKMEKLGLINGGENN